MFRNYRKTAFRNFLKYKVFSLINIFGLAIGIACCILAGLFIMDELSYDKQNKDADRIYRVVKDFMNDDGSKTPDATTPAAIAPAIQKDLPEVEHVARLFPRAWGNNFYVRYGEKKFIEENLYHADSSVFAVFTMPFIKGNPRTAFDDPNSIVLTESTATKYFGKEDPMGKMLEVDEFAPKMVTGIIKDIPDNAHFKIDLIASMKSLDENNRLSHAWGWYSFYTYMKLKPQSDIAAVDKKIRDVVKKNQPENKNYFYSQSLTSIHLNSNLKSELRPNSDKSYIYIFGTIALFILLIACINYINLTTARSSLRAKEIGARKIAGAAKPALIRQFLGESVMFSLLASILALAIAQFLLPAINHITGKHLTLNPNGNYFMLFAVLGFALLIGLLAGIYPALHLSSLSPVRAFKAEKFSGAANVSLRKILVVAQFTISIALITGTVIVMQQISFIQNAKLGLDKDHVIAINDVYYLSDDEKSSLKNDMLNIPRVIKVASSDAMLGSQNWTNMVKAKGAQNSHLINFLTVDEDFIDALGMKIKEGRTFSSSFPSDDHAGAIILNEKSIKELGLHAPYIGQEILWRENKQTGELSYAKLIGIVEDFHFTSMRNEIQPFAFVMKKNREWFFNVKMNGANMGGTIASIKKVWDKNVKSRPFQYTFMDETYAKLYESEMHFKAIFSYMAFISIFISCIGLFGFSLFMTEQRSKEIGIRKILGASVPEILRMISKDFIILVLISSVISFPLAWWAMHSWLQDFAYRININWWVFLLSGIFSVAIAMATISFQTIKAAISNPINALRSE